MILNIKVVDIAIFLRESKNHVRVSLRSKNNTDVSVIANHFDGGGHIMAAGCTLNDTNIKEAKKILLEYIDVK
jgi:phosphoesterase RecJ-like protein